MNEFYAFQPDEKLHPSELRRLLGYFGLPAGRYIVDYPRNWIEIILSHDWTEMERKRVVEKLKSLKERRGLFRADEHLLYAKDKDWISNVQKVVASTSTSKLFSRVLTTELCAPPVYDKFEYFEPVGVSEEHIAANPLEFARVCRVLLRVSHEVVFVDRFLDLTRKDYRDVIKALIQEASKGSCRKFTFIAYENKQRNIEQLRNESFGDFRRLHRGSFEFRILLLNGGVTSANISIHERLLLSSLGAISFDQGFASLGGGTKVKVSPVSELRAEEIYREFVVNEKLLPISDDILLDI